MMITCAICKKKFNNLGPHLKMHKMTGEEYKRKFNVEILTSVETSKRIGSRPYGDVWNKGLTVETDERVARSIKNMSKTKRERKKQGKIYQIWNKGLTMADPRLRKIWETRRKKDPNNLLAKKTWITRKENDPDDLWTEKMVRTTKLRNPNNECYKKAWVTRKLNDPNNNSHKRMVQTRKERYGPCGFKDHDALCKRMKTVNNDPDKLRRSLETMLERYGPSLMRDPEKVGKKHSEFMKKLWSSLTPKEKRQWLLASVLRGAQRPNNKEKVLIPILEPLGFIYNSDAKIVGEHTPDFIHCHLPLLVEYDGLGGHHPNNKDTSPFVPMNQEERDTKRDKDYRDHNHSILRLLPNDLKLGEEHIQNKVDNWVNNQSVLIE